MGISMNAGHKNLESHPRSKNGDNSYLNKSFPLVHYYVVPHNNEPPEKRFQPNISYE